MYVNDFWFCDDLTTAQKSLGVKDQGEEDRHKIWLTDELYW